MSAPVRSRSATTNAVRSGEALSVHVPSPHLFRVERSPSTRTEPARPRPLPRPPQPAERAASTSRPLPRRRASGGCFVDLAPLAPVKKTSLFYVCNPSDSPASPQFPPLAPVKKTSLFYVCNPSDSSASPQFPRSSDSPTSPDLSQFAFASSPAAAGFNIIPATPLPPYTPGLGRYSHAYLAPEKLDSPAKDPSSPDSELETETEPRLPTAKMHRRFGRSVGSIPATALEELRGLGERNRFSRPVEVAESDDADTSSDEEDNGEDNEDEEEEVYAWEVQKATRVTRPKIRETLKWTEELGSDRWIVDRYSSILRAL